MEPTEGRKKWNYHDYYDDNKEDINRRRRDRYASDPEYRERVKASAKQVKKAAAEAKKGHVARKYKGSKVLCTRIGDVAEAIGRSVSVIRFWEKEGTIPEPVFEGSQRVYTDAQVALLSKLSTALLKAGPDKRITVAIKKDMAPIIKKKWLGGL